MSLDERKIAILKALIEDYIETAEPVGSRTISKKFPLGLSSATIRNEMADLEEMGYLAQPHTSAGRIPSNMAYRFYVDSLIERISATNVEMEFIKSKLEANLSELNKFLDFSATAISDSTGLTTITKTPAITTGAIKHFEILKVSEHYLMLIIVTSTGIIKNRQIRILTPISEDAIYYIKNILNEELAGLTLETMTPKRIEHLKSRFNINFELLGVILDFTLETLEEQPDSEFYVSSKSSTLKAPEFTDREKVFSFLELVDNKETVNNLVATALNKPGITVIIGDENPLLKDKDLSLVVSTYKSYGNRVGAIGVIGPKRMDYGKVIATLETVSKLMSDVLEEGGESKNGGRDT